MSEEPTSARAFGCRVGYPMPDVALPDDDQTLELVAARHQGRVASMMLTSMPGQVDVSFGSLDLARAFMDELTGEGRFRIMRRPLAHPEKLLNFLVTCEGREKPRRVFGETYRRGARHVDFLATGDDGAEQVLFRLPAHQVVGIATDDEQDGAPAT